MAAHKKARDKMRQAGRQTDRLSQTNKQTNANTPGDKNPYPWGQTHTHAVLNTNTLTHTTRTTTWMKNVFISGFEIEFCNCRKEILVVVAWLQGDFHLIVTHKVVGLEGMFRWKKKAGTQLKICEKVRLIR